MKSMMRMGVGCGSTDQPGESGQSESDVRAAKRAEILSDSGESDKCLSNVADSSGLDRILSHNPIDSLHFKIPKAEAVDFVSTPEDCLDSATFEESKLLFGTGSLGLKRREQQDAAAAAAAATKTGSVLPPKSSSGGPLSTKAKTLAEKRYLLQQDIMKYGVAAIEKLYPRQQTKRFNKPTSPGEVFGARGTPVKMKPKPAGFEFDEVDVSKILRPNSHRKYIQEPAFDSVVFIARPKGIVPLSTLCPASETLMPTKPEALTQRNNNFGKPKLFVQDKGRLLAVGGSRIKSVVQYESLSKPIRIIRPPRLPVVDEEGRIVDKDLQEEFVPFQMSEDYVRLAVRALDTSGVDAAAEERRRREYSGKRERIDIRTIKREERIRRLANRPLESVLKSEKRSILNHLLDKMEATAEATEADLIEAEKEADRVEAAIKKEQPDILNTSSASGENVVLKLELESDDEEERNEANEADKENLPDNELLTPVGEGSPGLKVKDEVTSQDSQADSQEEEEEDAESVGMVQTPGGLPSSNPVHNLWSEDKNHAQLPDLIHDKPFVSDAFKQALKERSTNNELAGVDVCDVEGCFVCEDRANPTDGPAIQDESNVSIQGGTGAATATASGAVTPNPEAATPAATTADSKEEADSKAQKRKVEKSLKKVRRALKTLGVNFYEFDDKSGEGSKAGPCDKEFCRLGCLCDTLSSKPVAATHCGKAECMFRCFCSEEALKIAAAAALSPRDRAGGNLINAEGCVAKVRSTRRLAAEERKFNNTVVAATAGNSADYHMLGATAGRQRRERKVPTRYQDSDVFTAEMGHLGLGLGGKGPLGSVLGDLDDLDDSISGIGSSSRPVDEVVRRMIGECVRNETVTRCAVLVPQIPLPPDTKVWCMYHCQYDCECRDLQNPLDYGPDLTASRNVSKRSLGGNFKTQKRRSSEDFSAVVSSSPSTDLPGSLEAMDVDGPSPAKKVAPIEVGLKDKSTPHITSAEPLLFELEEHCARTSGVVVRKTQGVKNPHKVVVIKKSKTRRSSGDLTCKETLPSRDSMSLSSPPPPQPADGDEIVEVPESIDSVTSIPRKAIKAAAPLRLREGLLASPSKPQAPAPPLASPPAQNNEVKENTVLPPPQQNLGSPTSNLNPSLTTRTPQTTQPDSGKESLPSLANYVAKDFSLPLKPKGATQYMKWGLIQSGLADGPSKAIKLWSFYRNARPVLFLSRLNELPYFRNATDLQVLVKHNGEKGIPAEIPQIIKDLLLGRLRKQDADKFAILNSNGLAWEVTGVLQRKESELMGNNQQQQQARQPVRPSPVTSAVAQQHQQQMIQRQMSVSTAIPPAPHPKHLAAISNHDPPTVNAQGQVSAPGQVDHSGGPGGCVVSIGARVEKLPLGQSLVTLVRENDANFQPVIQIKLPEAMKHQHWSIIRVEGEEGSVQCPDSYLALKVDVLREAAVMALKENTTVRIPIAVKGGPDTFGVYAVPGLHSHVFVGPFSNKTPGDVPNDVITLDDEDEDIQEVTAIEQPGSTSAQPVRPSLTEEQKRYNKRCIARYNREVRAQAVMGQVPQVVTNEPKATVVSDGTDGTDEIVVLIDDEGQVAHEPASEKEVEKVTEPSPEGNKEASQEKAEESQVEPTEVVSESTNPSGVAGDQSLDKTPPPAVPQYLNIKQSKFGTVVIVAPGTTEENRGKPTCEVLTIVVPRYGSHELFCIGPEKVHFKHPNFENHEVRCKSIETAKLWLEEFVVTKELDEAEKSPSSPKKKSVDALDDGSSDRKHKLLAVDRKSHKELVGLFYSLNQLLKANDGEQKSVNCVQVLSRAKDTVLGLQAQHMEMEQTRKALMLKRAKLFEEFVGKLNVFPASVKKKALLETKEVLQKIKSQRNEAPSAASQQGQPQQTSAALKQAPKPAAPPPTKNPVPSTESSPTRQLQTIQPAAALKPRPAETAPAPSVNTSTTTSSLEAPGSPPLLTIIPPGAAGKQQLSAAPSPSSSTASTGSASAATPYSDVTGLSTVKKDGKVLRPMNAFMLWTKNYRRELIAKGIDGASVSKILAEEWKKLGEEEKKKYSDEAERLKSLHQLQHPNYKYSPRARRIHPANRKISFGEQAVQYPMADASPAPAPGFTMVTSPGAGSAATSPPGVSLEFSTVPSQQMSPGMLAATVSAAAQQQGLVPPPSSTQPQLSTAHQHPTFQVTTAPQFIQHAGVPGGTPMESAAPSLRVGGTDVNINTATSAAPGHFVPVSELAGAAAVAPPIAVATFSANASQQQPNISIVPSGFIQAPNSAALLQQGTPSAQGKNIVEISVD